MKQVKCMLKYAWLTIKHKWFVLIAGRRLKVPLWRLIVHDLSKFSRAELPGYGRQFFGSEEEKDSEQWARTWLHHQNFNDHHWEHWLIRRHGDKDGNTRVPIALPMPEVCIREMVADWCGAGRAYEGTWPYGDVDWPWLRANFYKMNLHLETHKRILDVVDEYVIGRLPESRLGTSEDLGSGRGRSRVL